MHPLRQMGPSLPSPVMASQAAMGGIPSPQGAPAFKARLPADCDLVLESATRLSNASMPFVCRLAKRRR